MRTFRRRLSLRRFVRNENGSIIVETALMITVLLLLVFGIVDMGRSLFVANTLISAARDGARFAVVHADDANILTDTKNLVVARFNTYRFGGPALLTDSVAVTLVGKVGTAPPKSIQVKIGYPFNWLTPVPRLLRWTTNATYTSVIHSQAELKYEY
jgi:Flp pilus assembly protein TadG